MPKFLIDENLGRLYIVTSIAPVAQVDRATDS